MENQYTYYTPDQDDQNQNGQGGYQYQPQDEKPPKKKKGNREQNIERRGGEKVERNGVLR